MKMNLLEKACSKCAVVKPIGLFKKNSKCKGGYTGQCKCCVNESLKEKRASGLYKANRALANACNSKYKKANLGKCNAHTAKRRARLLLATVGWSCEEAIKIIYEEASLLGMEVDHVIPLQGKEVCGLHCEDNLQLLTPKENKIKGNRI
tara:strand:+ start:24 stop:470 length:447 start_codon:yes stop_codon:yes gene_type:complete